MSLWVRSQNKEKLIECNRIELREHQVISIIGFGLEDSTNCYLLGYYSTKEKALKVLDKMEMKIDDIAFRDMYGRFVFQMPQDNEV